MEDFTIISCNAIIYELSRRTLVELNMLFIINISHSISANLYKDFSSLFHWNVKQLFVYITLEYTTPKYKRNEIVFWDKILTSSNSPRLSITGLRNKYAVVDIDDQLPGSNAQIKLHWNTMPFVGFLGDTRKGHIDVRIPDIGEKQ